MEVKVITKEKNVLELEFDGADQSLAQVLAQKLNDDKDVEFAAYKLEHPLIAQPRLVVRTKKGDPSKLLLSKLKELKDEVADFKKQFLEIAK